MKGKRKGTIKEREEHEKKTREISRLWKGVFKSKEKIIKIFFSIFLLMLNFYFRKSVQPCRHLQNTNNYIKVIYIIRFCL